MAGKRNNTEFQQETEERFAKYDALFEKILGELQTLNVRKEQKDDGVLTINANHKPYLKLHFPRFSGDDPTGWIYQAEQYFEFQNVATTDQVSLASFHLDGIALQWHRWYTKTRGPLTWRSLPLPCSIGLVLPITRIRRRPYIALNKLPP
ncbi:hypothetical protein HanRHA438_Chr05g0225021 [Helianthus annuus]|nr:hypothetical protein HanRHA438_Chr05g0225021 [Helianthus annuus]